MTAPKLTALGRVEDADGINGRVLVAAGRIYCPSECGVSFDASPDAVSAYAALLNVDGGVRVTIEPADASEPAPVPTIEQIKTRLRSVLPNYRKLGFEPNAKSVITDISAEVAKMIEEARR